jgi:hypothetical protein
MTQNTALETVIIFTPNMEKLAAFYGEGLGIGPYQESPGHLGCNVGPIYLASTKWTPLSQTAAASPFGLQSTI